MSTPTYGLTPQGFVPKPQTAILADIEAALQGTFGAAINLEPESNFAQFAGIFAEQLAELWEAGESIYDSQYPDSATGTALDNVCAITGTVRLPETVSTVAELLGGTVGTVVPAGTVVQVQDNGGNFVTTEDSVPLVSAPAWPRNTNVTLGEFFSQDGNLYVCTGAGLTANVAHAGGYWTDLTSTAVDDGTAVWRFLGAAAAIATVPAAGQETGPVVAPAYTLTSIQTPTFGLAIVVNLLDAAPGVNQEPDGDLRIRREAELRGAGNGNADAIRAQVLELEGVLSCTVFENDTDAVDGDGLPPHSINVLVQGGTDQEIADAIWASKAAGIATFGAQSATVTDASGNEHTINWDLPTLLDVWITVDLVPNDPADTSLPQFPADGVAEVQAALMDWADGLLLDEGGTPLFAGYGVGDPVVTSKLYVPIETVAGIYDVTHIYLGLAADPASPANITPTSRQLVQLDTSRIVVNVS